MNPQQSFPDLGSNTEDAKDDLGQLGLDPLAFSVILNCRGHPRKEHLRASGKQLNRNSGENEI